MLVIRKQAATEEPSALRSESKLPGWKTATDLPYLDAADSGKDGCRIQI